MSFIEHNIVGPKGQEQVEDSVPKFMKSELKKEEIKPRAYNEFTKKLDKNYHKLNLRK